MERSRRISILTKLAGGGSRTLKSLRRVLERIDMGAEGSALSRVAERGLLRNQHAPRPGTHRSFFTEGGAWTPRDRLKFDDHGPLTSIPLGDVRRMRGKFGIDPMAMTMPVGQEGNALVFHGRVPDGIARPVTRRIRALPEESLIHETQWNPGGGVDIRQHDINLMRRGRMSPGTKEEVDRLEHYIKRSGRA